MLCLFKDILARAAQRTAPVGRQVFKGCTGVYTVVRVTYCWIVLILADVADILLHWFFSFSIFLRGSGFPSDSLHRTAIKSGLYLSLTGPFRVETFGSAGVVKTKNIRADADTQTTTYTDFLINYRYFCHFWYLLWMVKTYHQTGATTRVQHNEYILRGCIR